MVRTITHKHLNTDTKISGYGWEDFVANYNSHSEFHDAEHFIGENVEDWDEALTEYRGESDTESDDELELPDSSWTHDDISVWIERNDLEPVNGTKDERLQKIREQLDDAE